MSGAGRPFRSASRIHARGPADRARNSGTDFGQSSGLDESKMGGSVFGQRPIGGAAGGYRQPTIKPEDGGKTSFHGLTSQNSGLDVGGRAPSRANYQSGPSNPPNSRSTTYLGNSAGAGYGTRQSNTSNGPNAMGGGGMGLSRKRLRGANEGVGRTLATFSSNLFGTTLVFTISGLALAD